MPIDYDDADLYLRDRVNAKIRNEIRVKHSMIKKIIKEEFDVIVTHGDILNEINNYRTTISRFFEFGFSDDGILRKNYRECSPGARHKGVSVMMTRVMQFIYRTRKREGDAFQGVSLYDIQQSMKKYGISNHTVRDNLFRLVKYGFVKIKKMKNARGSGKSYVLNDKAFMCRYGDFVIYDRMYNMTELYTISCPMYLECSYQVKDCVFPLFLKDLKHATISQHEYEHFKKKMESMQKDAVSHDGRVITSIIPIPEHVIPMIKMKKKFKTNAEIAEHFEDMNDVKVGKMLKKYMPDYDEYKLDQKRDPIEIMIKMRQNFCTAREIGHRLGLNKDEVRKLLREHMPDYKDYTPFHKIYTDEIWRSKFCSDYMKYMRDQIGNGMNEIDACVAVSCKPVHVMLDGIDHDLINPHKERIKKAIVKIEERLMHTIPNRAPSSILAAAVYLGSDMSMNMVSGVINVSEPTIREVLSQVKIKKGNR